MTAAYLQDWKEYKRAQRAIAVLDRAANHLKSRGQRRVGPSCDFVVLTDAGDCHAFITITAIAREIEGSTARRPMVHLGTGGGYASAGRTA